LFKNKFFQYFLLSLYLFASSVIIFENTKQTYGVNDDVIIQNWLSGFYTGTPELMIRGSATPRISFGYLVSNLYELVPGINWFSIILLFMTLLSWYLLGILAFRSKNYLVTVIYFVVSFLHLLWFIPSPTYTASGVILSFSTLIFLLKSISENSLNVNFIAISMIYVFGFLIRPESFLLGSAATLPFIIFTTIKYTKIIRKEFKIILVSAIFVFSIIGIDIVFEKIYYKSNVNWSEYNKWETARYEIQANAPEKAVLENPEKYSWSKAEAEIFKNYNSIDPSYFNESKLNKLILDTQTSTSIDFKFINKAHQQIFDSDINWEWKRLIQLISLVYFIFLLLSLPRPLYFICLSLSSLSIIYLIMLYVAGFLRQPERVQVSVIFLCILVGWISFIFTKESNSRNELNQYSILGWGLVVLVAAAALDQSSYLKNKVAGASNVFWLTQSSYLSKFPKDSIFVGNASQFRNNWISPYKIEYFEVEKRILSFGWHNFSPHWVKRANNLGLDPDNMFKSIIQDPRVYWVSDSESMEYIITFMNEQNYKFSGPDIVGEMEYVGNDYTVWNFNPYE
jgi:hypothetical protein